MEANIATLSNFIWLDTISEELRKVVVYLDTA